MDLPWGDERTKQFITNVGLITSKGPHGDNIMACEWTHHVSYSPGLIAVCIHSYDATADNILQTKVFGVNLCATDQNMLSSLSGNYSGKTTDKIKALKELGYVFFKAKKIDVLLVEGAALHLECKLMKQILLGDHLMFIGEVIETSLPGKEPLLLHGGKYWKVGEQIQKPAQEELDRIKKVMEKHKK